MLILLIIKISRFARNDKKTNCDTVSDAGGKEQKYLPCPPLAEVSRSDGGG